MNNSENNNNEGLNSISLGSIGNNPNATPSVPNNAPTLENSSEDPMAQVETLDDGGVVTPPSGSNEIPVMEPPLVDVPADNPIPDGSQAIPDVNAIPPVAPVNYDIPQPINDVNASPFANEIGTVPPIPDAPISNTPAPTDNTPPKKKSGLPKSIFVLIVVLALAAVGVGVYILLGIAKNSVSVVTKPVNIELNGEVSSNINDYADFKGIDSSKCSLDTTGIKETTELGKEYSFIITCKDTRYTGTAKIVDTTPPEVKTKTLTVGLNELVNPGDFIDGDCKDATECSYAFKDEDKVKEYLEEEGTYDDVVIVIKDESGNEIEKTVTLEVSSASVEYYLNCTKSGNGYDEITKLGLNSQNMFNKIGVKSYVFHLDSNEYNSLKASSSTLDNMSYKNLSGKPTFNDTDLTLTLSKDMTYDELVKEANGDIPESYAELVSFYGNLGYTSCKIGY